MASQSDKCFRSSGLGFGGRYAGRVFEMTCSRALGPVDFEERCVGVLGSVRGSGSEEDGAMDGLEDEDEALIGSPDCKTFGE